MTNTERITLHVCNKHSVGVPYPFTTLDTELELTIKDYVIVAACLSAGGIVLGLIAVGAVTVIRWCL